MPVRVGAEAGSAAPFAVRLEHLSEFFDNEVSTGKLAGAVALIQQHDGRFISSASASAMSPPNRR
jgi:hypothetical protein